MSGNAMTCIAVSIYWQLLILISIHTFDFFQIQDRETPKGKTRERQGRCKDVPASDTKTSEAKQMLALARQDGKQHSFYF